MNNKNNLICGDTNSDVPMVSTAINKNENSQAIFVTENEELKNKVRKICDKSFFVSCPDVLVSILNNLAEKE